MEFQAVIFAAGIGTRFRDIVASRPKCLLPVGSFPLIFYPLNFCSKYGFEEVIIIVLESQKTEIAQRVSKLPLKMKYDFVCLNQEEDYGTADALRLVADRIKTDVLLISCDTITDVDFYPLLNLFRTNDASCVALFDSGSEENSNNIVVPGVKAKHKAERDLVGIDSKNNRLLFLASTTDFQDNFSLPAHLLRSFGEVDIYSNLTDAHMYLIKHWVINYISKSEKFSTIKGELLPFIIKKQLSKPPAAVTNRGLNISEVNFDTNDIFDHIERAELEKRIQETNLSPKSYSKKSKNSEMIKCFAYVAPQNSFCMRINTILNYCIINKKIASLLTDFNLPLISKNATIKSTQITDCCVAENCTIAEKTSIKNTIFGIGCHIEQRTRINDSILMSNVNVEEGVKLENCIICDKATIKMGSTLKNCLVGHNFIVTENTIKERVHLTGEGFMEI
ncbi:hypothetical protein PVAND_011479 [Polypedilum vanderplanki]|uniref:Translation initiation factor eIF2B subunit gamma n=1 Tax=Polypedilum vanderplanki TaxID=319348 RepID=A0A9J6CJC3_POLVA|nr:hypothetical protein PVAND_011479 [Polypedilum vanderplanki]